MTVMSRRPRTRDPTEILGTAHAREMSRTANHKKALDQLTELLEELLDAHCDTICFEEDEIGGSRWAAHVDYLRDLQRVGQRSLAQLAGAGA